ncbi:hypothetical protein BJY04DRAFT_212459 [Aspergillus karnatakaensis]|uniref:uncharacterized protein n=1 Tax=Aspergillus karnatakaensis TaxID=1810916 RepID=UPI003CCE0BF8
MSSASMGGLMLLMDNSLCADAILSYLPRASLKDLRLTSRSLNETVLALSHLFSRAYISAGKADLVVLEAMSSTPHIAACVTELIWDVTVEPRYNQGNYIEDDESRTAIERLMNEYADALTSGTDLVALLSALPRFSRLKSVVLTEIMVKWAYLAHEPGFSPRTQTRFLPARSGLSYYQSPAMRAWTASGLPRLGAVVEYHHTVPVADGAAALAALEALVRGIVSEGNSGVEGMSSVASTMEALHTHQERAPLLLLAASRALGISLQSLSFEAVGTQWSKWPMLYARQSYRGINMGTLASFDTQLERMGQLSSSLRRLCLCFDVSPDWWAALKLLLASTRDLRTLELRPTVKESLTCIDFPALPHLRTLVLDNFLLKEELLKVYLLDWSAETSLQTLHLVNCEIILPPGTSAKDTLQSFVDRDITPQERLYITYREAIMAQHELVPKETESDTSSSEFPEDDDTYTDSIPADTAFDDIDFGPESELTSEDEFEANDVFIDDHKWALPPGAEAKYDHDYDDDTPDLGDELPISPVGAEFVSLFSEFEGESYEFFLNSGQVGRVLRVVIEGFKVRSEGA